MQGVYSAQMFPRSAAFRGTKMSNDERFEAKDKQSNALL